MKALWRLYYGRRPCTQARVPCRTHTASIKLEWNLLRIKKTCAWKKKLEKKLKNKNKSKVHSPLFVLPCSDFAHAAHRGNHSAVDPIVIVNGRQPLVLLQNNTHDARREKYQLSQHVPLQFVPTKSQRTYAPFSFLLLWAFFSFFIIFFCCICILVFQPQRVDRDG